MSTFTSLIQHSAVSPSQSNETGRRNKGIQTGKEEVQLSLFADDIILYIENPRFHQETTGTDKLIQQRAGCKISIQESVVLLYANNELTEREIKKAIPFMTAS